MNELAQRGKGGARDVIAEWLRSGTQSGKEEWSADSILSALEEAGFAIVPVEASEAMLKAYYKGDAPLTAPDCYRFLVSAAKDED